MIELDLLEDDALIRGDTYEHVFRFSDENNVELDMAAGPAVYACEFRNRTNTLRFIATATALGGLITVTA